MLSINVNLKVFGGGDYFTILKKKVSAFFKRLHESVIVILTTYPVVLR